MRIGRRWDAPLVDLVNFSGWTKTSDYSWYRGTEPKSQGYSPPTIFLCMSCSPSFRLSLPAMPIPVMIGEDWQRKELLFKRRRCLEEGFYRYRLARIGVFVKACHFSYLRISVCIHGWQLIVASGRLLLAL